MAPEPTQYVAQWLRFDNATHQTAPIGTTSSKETRILAPSELPQAAGSFIRVELSAEGGPDSWAAPVHAYFVRESGGWRLIGFERVPEGNPPGSKR